MQERASRSTDCSRVGRSLVLASSARTALVWIGSCFMCRPSSGCTALRCMTVDCPGRGVCTGALGEGSSAFAQREEL